MKPKEGTILTVAKGVAEKAQTLAEETDDLEEFLPKLIEEAETVLAKTPDMLPVLKEAGVVDSGGQGLLEVLRGAYDHSSVKRLTTAHLHQLLRLLMQQRLKLRVQWISNLDTVPNLLFSWTKNLQKRMK